MAFLPRFALLLLMSVFLTGCGGNWLIGKWTIDQDRTLEAMTADQNPTPDEPGKGLLKDIVGGLQKGLSRVLLAQFEGVEVEFTSSEMRRVQGGVGEAQLYEIIDRPDASSYVVKYADGEIVTWSKVESGIRLKLTGDGGMWVYFRTVE
ncbi:MAG: hypothetical protein P1U87_06560 [Verrucomicrobiales bacterium]|nr:hypothetical protein [Verrucomicrobiales bacterium]